MGRRTRRVGGGDGEEEGMGRRRGCGEEGMGRRRGWGGGGDGEEEGMGKRGWEEEMHYKMTIVTCRIQWCGFGMGTRWGLGGGRDGKWGLGRVGSWRWGWGGIRLRM